MRSGPLIVAYSLRSLLVVVALLFATTCSQAFDEIDDAPRGADTVYSQELKQLAAWTSEKKLSAQAARVAAWHIPRGADRFVVFDVPDATGRAVDSKPDAAASADTTEFDERFARIRGERAATLFRVANDAAKVRRKGLAYELLWETLREDVNHAEARRMLGFEKTDAGWATPYSAKQLRAGRVRHERFGWIAKADVERWEAGERQVGNRWVTAEQDAKRHADIRVGWQIETEHYSVSTNHSREEGVRLAGDLERLHRAWRQVFVDYWLSDPEFDRMFGLTKAIGPQAVAAAKAVKHRVVYYRNREEYVRALSTSQPNVGMSLGVYLDAGRAAHFFAGPEQHPATVFHEATHQLFKETKITAKHPGRRHGMWLIEASACYMESLRRREGFDTLGERDAGRFAAAAEKIDEGFYVRIGDLMAMSSDDLQKNPDIAKLYSQAAGQMRFFLHGESGRHRPAIARALDAIYADKAGAATLAQACETPYDRLDEAYLEFVRKR